MMFSMILLTYMLLINSWAVHFTILPMLLIYSILNMFSPMATYNTHLSLFGVSDQMSMMLIALTIWTTLLMFMNSTKIMYSNSNPNMFARLNIILMVILITAFLMQSMLSFYVFFEASLIPTLMIILMWGYQPERLEAGTYLMMYTITASLPLLMSLLIMQKQTGSISWLLSPHMGTQSILLNLSLMLAFLAKIPMYPLHLWLPKAHVEAPVAGSMILASVLLKLGVYGLMRMMIIIPKVIEQLSLSLMTISLGGALLTSIICVRTLDVKMLIAYASVSHMGILTAALMTNSKWGFTGAMMMMIAHGMASSGLFTLANYHYEVVNTRNLLLFSGLLFLSPSMSMMWFIMIMMNMAAPPSLNLLSEMFIISSIWMSNPLTGLFLFFIPFFSVVYSLVLYTTLTHGAPNQMAPKYYSTKKIHMLSTLLHSAPVFLMFFTPMLFMT